MSYEPLHHKYRPQTFAALVGQEAIATTLTNAISSERIAPAYLFTGPRGTGKTSSARILAKSLNCLDSNKPTKTPCGTCDVCQGITKGTTLDVIEIDAASNTGVDNIREIIERAQFAPVQCRYKVYVVDECHMLSVQAFNALLKTLEEPPLQVVFVLATTDPQRVLPTIISRCQRFDFRRIPLESMVAHLQKIASLENINITPEAVQLVAQVAQGGLRDAESLLDQLSLLPGQVTVERVWDLVGFVAEPDLMTLLQAIAQNDPEAVIDCTRTILDRGREPLTVLQNLAGFYRDLLIAKTAPRRNDLVACTQVTWSQLCEFAKSWDTATILAGQQHLVKSEIQIKNTTQPRLWLEATLLGLLPLASSSQQQATRDTKIGNKQPLSQASDPNREQLETSNQSLVSPKTHIQPQPPNSTAPVKSINHSVPSTQVAPTSPPPEGTSAKNVPSPIEPPSSLQTLDAKNPLSDLEGIWQQLLECMSSPSRALFKEHGHLLAINGQQAQITLRTANLVKIAQNKSADVEAAFQKVFAQKMKVSLEVAVSNQTKSTPLKVPSPTTDTPPLPHPTEPVKSNSATTSSDQTDASAHPAGMTREQDREDSEQGNSEHPGARGEWGNGRTTSAHGSTFTPSAPNPKGNSFPLSPEETLSPLTSISLEPFEENIEGQPVATEAIAHDPTLVAEDDEVAIAAQRLADFFKGEVVNFDLDSTLLQAATTASLSQAITPLAEEFSAAEPEDDEDIDF